MSNERPVNPELKLFGEMWDFESNHKKMVWFATQRGHLQRQIDGVMEVVEHLMRQTLTTPATPDDIDFRVDCLNSRVRYISQYAQAVYAARQKAGSK